MYYIQQNYKIRIIIPQSDHFIFNIFNIFTIIFKYNYLNKLMTATISLKIALQII